MDNRNEKKIIIYLIIISLGLIYFSLFFIHDIVDRGRIKDTATGTIMPPDNNVEGESIDKGNNGGSVDKENNGKLDEEYVIDNSDRFKVLQGETEWSKLKELDLFNNSYFEDKSIIAPGVQGSYSFTVENESESKFIYDMVFTEENPYEINMVFKLKLNGEYVLGNEQQWIKASELKRSNVFLGAKVSNIYTVEWKWEDNYNDTEIGETEGAYYKMYIKVNAEQIIE